MTLIAITAGGDSVILNPRLDRSAEILKLRSRLVTTAVFLTMPIGVFLVTSRCLSREAQITS